MQIVKDWFKNHFNNPQVVVLTLIILGGLLVVIYLGQILLPLLVGVVIAYMLDGLVVLFQKFRLPRLVAVLFVYLIFLTIFASVIFGLVPLIATQLTQAARELPDMADRIQESINTLPEKYSFLEEEQVNDFVGAFTERFQAWAKEVSPQTIINWGVSSFRSMLVMLVYMILVPILVFFMLKDKEQLLGWASRFVPSERRLTIEVWRDVDKQIANYVRGKFWEIIIVGSMTFVTFKFLGLNYPTLLAILVGFSVIVPYVGVTVITLPVAVVAYAQHGFAADFLYALLAYAIIQTIDGNILVPLIFSEAVHLHPIAIIVAVLLFGGIWGIWGAFFAIPLATLVQAVIKAWPAKPPDKPAPDKPVEDQSDESTASA